VVGKGGVVVSVVVIGRVWVVMTDCVIKIVETVVSAGKVKVDTKLDPGSDTVLKMVEAGKVTVESTVVVVTLPGTSLTTVDVTAGWVMVDRIVLGGNCVVTTEVSPGSWMTDVTTPGGRVSVETTVLAGNWVVTIEVVPGSWIVEVTISPGKVTVESCVVAGSWVVTVERLPGSVRVDVTIWPGCVNVSVMVVGNKIDVEVTVVGARVRVETAVEMTVLGGISVVIVDVAPGSVVVVTKVWGGNVNVLSWVDTSVRVCTTVSVRSTVSVGPGTSTVGPGISIVCSEVMITVCGTSSVNVDVTKTSETIVWVLMLVEPGRVIVVGMNSVVVNVDTDVDMLVVQEVSVVLTVCVVVVGCKLIMVSIGPGIETVWIVVSVGPGTDMVGPGTVCITETRSVKVSVAVVCDITVEVLIVVVPGNVKVIVS
jgi:hypothetical protein